VPAELLLCRMGEQSELVDEKVTDSGGSLLFTIFRKLPRLDLGCKYHPYCVAAEEKNRLSFLMKRGQYVQVASSTSIFSKLGRCQAASEKLKGKQKAESVS
jgi:hypothetical protein